jgi:Putative prokaryotic signal transducing protein
MPEGDPVLIRSFPDLVSADMAVEALQDASIESMIVSDDLGGTLPSMQSVRGVKLYVAADAEAEARAVLDAIDDAPPLEETADAGDDADGNDTTGS